MVQYCDLFVHELVAVELILSNGLDGHQTGVFLKKFNRLRKENNLVYKFVEGLVLVDMNLAESDLIMSRLKNENNLSSAEDRLRKGFC